MQLKLVSDKYDTSQVKLYVDSAFKEIDHKGKCNFKGSNCYQNGGTLYYSYGQFAKNITLYVCDKSVILDEIAADGAYKSANINWYKATGHKLPKQSKKSPFIDTKDPVLHDQYNTMVKRLLRVAGESSELYGVMNADTLGSYSKKRGNTREGAQIGLWEKNGIWTSKTVLRRVAEN